jgi:hypothetical protein
MSMHTKFWWKRLDGRYKLEDLCIEGRMILKQI